MLNRIQVKIAEKETSYDIRIDSEPVENLRDKILQAVGDNKYLVVISQKVYRIYRKKLGFPKQNIFVLKDGEIQKNFKNYQKILKCAQERKLNRQSAIIAIGGGVVGDIAGFVAATYMRGIAFYQVPTTLLACVDSSVGGKVAIDTEYGKNLVGAFYQPKEVFINLNFLKTLDKRQYKSGLAEVIKYAFIEKSCEASGNDGLFDFLNINYEKILKRDLAFLEKIIQICLKLKISVVAKDEKEQGLRKILNFGHTYGHAIEKLTHYKKFTHGEAIIYGMYFIIEYAHKNQMISDSYMNLTLELLEKYDYSDKKFRFNSQKLLEALQSDKKSENNTVKIILPLEKGIVTEGNLNIETAFSLLL